MSSQQDPRLYSLGRLTGIFLILGFILPVMIPSYRGVEFMFPNIQALFMGELPFSAIVMLIWPLIGGILAFVALGKEGNGTRALFFLVIGFLPMLFGSSMTSMMAGGMGRGMRGMDGLGVLGMGGSTMFFASTGLLFLIAGAISGRIRNNHFLPAVIAGIGGGMILLALLIPVGGGYTSIVPISAPFMMIEQAPLQAIGIIIMMVLLIVAAVNGLTWAFKNKEGVNKADSILNMLKGAFWFIIAFIFINMFIYTGGRGMGMAILTLIFMIIKVVTMAGGILFAKVMAISEVISYEGSEGNFDIATFLNQGGSGGAAAAGAAAAESKPQSDSPADNSSSEQPGPDADGPDPLAQEEAKMNLEQKLEELKALKEKGLLTDEEYEIKRKKLIDGF